MNEDESWGWRRQTCSWSVIWLFHRKCYCNSILCISIVISALVPQDQSTLEHYALTLKISSGCSNKIFGKIINKYQWLLRCHKNHNIFALLLLVVSEVVEEKWMWRSDRRILYWSKDLSVQRMKDTGTQEYFFGSLLHFPPFYDIRFRGEGRSWLEIVDCSQWIFINFSKWGKLLKFKLNIRDWQQWLDYLILRLSVSSRYYLRRENESPWDSLVLREAEFY